jgi:hypothetical protein
MRSVPVQKVLRFHRESYTAGFRSQALLLCSHSSELVPVGYPAELGVDRDESGELIEDGL